jgi:hypothetical protein
MGQVLFFSPKDSLPIYLHTSISSQTLLTLYLLVCCICKNGAGCKLLYYLVSKRVLCFILVCCFCMNGAGCKFVEAANYIINYCCTQCGLLAKWLVCFSCIAKVRVSDKYSYF